MVILIMPVFMIHSGDPDITAMGTRLDMDMDMATTAAGDGALGLAGIIITDMDTTLITEVTIITPITIVTGLPIIQADGILTETIPITGLM